MVDAPSAVTVSAIVAFATAFVTAYVTAKAASYSKDVIEERQKWRDRMREIAIEAAGLIRAGDTQSREFRTIISEFRLRLNPDDVADVEIVRTLNNSLQDASDLKADKLLAQISRLLKHDWERSKSEADLFGWAKKPNGRNIRTLRSYDYLAPRE